MIAGSIDCDNRNPIGQKIATQANSAHGLASIPFDDRDCWQNGRITLAEQQARNTASSHNYQGIVCHGDSGVRCVAWARIDNRPELVEVIPADLHYLCNTAQGTILAAYLHWGSDCCTRLFGDFCFVIFDPRAQLLFCARDHLGVKPFYYFWDQKNFAFASSLAVLAVIDDLDLELSEQWLARFLLGRSNDWVMTAYENVQKLPPGHCLAVCHGEMRLERYFGFSSEVSHSLKSDQDYVDLYREHLDESVRCRIDSCYPVGSESSGGLDSSTVTALAAQWMPDPSSNLHSFGFAGSEQSPECILSVSQRSPMYMTHMVTTTGDSRKTRNRYHQEFMEVGGVADESGIAPDHGVFYETARKWGIRTMLSGFGGDEFTTNYGSTALVEFWINRQFGKFYSRHRGSLGRPARSLKWIYNFYRHGNRSLISRNLSNNSKALWDNRIVEQKIIDQFELGKTATNDHQYDAGYTSPNAFSLGNRWSPQMTGRLECCTLMAARYCIEYRWPLLDVRLLELFLSIPSEQKLGPGGISRYLHRRAVSGLVPDLVNWKSKNMGAPVRPSKEDKVCDASADIDFDNLDPRLRSVVCAEKLQKLVATNPSGELQNFVRDHIVSRVRKLDAWLKIRS